MTHFSCNFITIPHTPILNLLNHCQLYLQVLLVSDITFSDGLHILPGVKYGKLFHRKSSLRWPSKGYPSKADWQLWRSNLGFLEHENKLQAPLGKWISRSQQEWNIFYHLTHCSIYELSGGIWLKTTPNSSQVTHTPTYNNLTDTTETASTPSDLVPATIIPTQSSSKFWIQYGPTLQNPVHSSELPIFTKSNLQHIIGLYPPSDTDLQNICMDYQSKMY
jgi:hypothetical protein